MPRRVGKGGERLAGERDWAAISPSQLIRSGTSAGPNYEEGCAAESRADFVHKLSICLKELRESRFWIRLIVKSELLPTKKIADLEDECYAIVQDTSRSSLVTAKKEKRQTKRNAVRLAAFCILQFAFFILQFFPRSPVALSQRVNNEGLGKD